MATRNVFGTYLNIDNTPCRGSIEFTPSSFVVKRGTAIYLQKTKICYLDKNGSFTVDLTVSDDPNLVPDWLWLVEEKIAGGKIWYMEVPTGASPLDISTVVPLSAPASLMSFEEELEILRARIAALELR